MVYLANHSLGASTHCLTTSSTPIIQAAFFPNLTFASADVRFCSHARMASQNSGSNEGGACCCKYSDRERAEDVTSCAIGDGCEDLKTSSMADMRFVAKLVDEESRAPRRGDQSMNAPPINGDFLFPAGMSAFSSKNASTSASMPSAV